MTKVNTQSRLLRLGEVMTKTGLSRSTLYMMVNKSRFPAPVNIGLRAVAWVDDEVDQWILDRINKRTLVNRW
jgi:prophage regulatory protein